MVVRTALVVPGTLVREMTAPVAIDPRAIARKAPVDQVAVVIAAAPVPARRERRRAVRHADVCG
jgi:hypothetical protein